MHLRLHTGSTASFCLDITSSTLHSLSIQSIERNTETQAVNQNKICRGKYLDSNWSANNPKESHSLAKYPFGCHSNFRSEDVLRMELKAENIVCNCMSREKVGIVYDVVRAAKQWEQRKHSFCRWGFLLMSLR